MEQGPTEQSSAAGGEMGALIRAHDWAATPLGPMGNWPPSLRTAVDLLLAAPQPIYVAWGPQLTSLYNNGYIPILGAKHPGGLGLPYAALFAEIWDEYRPLTEAVLAGEAQYFVDRPVPLVGRGADGPLSYFTFSWTPLRDAAGRVAGFYCAAIETTEKVRAVAAVRANEERRSFLLRLSDALRPLSATADIMHTATRIVGEQVQANIVLYAEINDDGDTIHRGDSYTHGVSARSRDTFLANAFSGIAVTALRRGKTSVAADVADLDGITEAERGAYAALRIASFVLVPLVKGGRWVASLGIYHGSPRHWTAEDIASVQEATERTWAAVERARADAALHASEARFRSFAESSADTLWIVEAATRRLEFLSPSFERMWGESRAAVLGDLGRWAELVHPDDREQAAQVLPRALAGEAAVADYRIVRPANGAVRWIRDTGFPIRDERGRVTRVAGIAQDITDQKEAEAALRASEERFQLAAAAVNAIIYDWDLTTGQVERTRGLPEELGYSEDEAGLAAGDWLRLIHPDDQEQAEVATRDALVGAAAGYTTTYRIRARDGTHRHFWDHGRIVRDEQGQARRVVGSTVDITALKQAEEARDTLLATASHELQTPLTSIVSGLGLLELGAGHTLGPAERALLAAARRNADRLRWLIADLLAAQRGDPPQAPAARDPLDLRAVVASAVADVQPLYQQKEQTTDLDVPDPLPVIGDARRLEQIMVNLLANAARHTPAGARVTVTGRATEVEIHLSIHDTGPGIPHSQLETIFSRFQRLGRTTDGMGLGLAIAQEAATKHGGRLWAESTLGEGTTFHLILPRARPPDEKERA